MSSSTEGYDEPGRSFPVATWLYGSGGNIGSRPQPLLDSLQSGEHAAFLVEPQGKFHTRSGATGGSRHVYCVPGTTPSIDLLFGMFDEIETLYPIDASRRILTGTSRGGVSSFQLALLR